MLDTTRLKADLGTIQAHLARVAQGPRGRDVLSGLRSSSGLAIPAGKLLWQALHNDCLRILYLALAADEQIVDDEVEAVYEYMFSVARHYAEIMPARYGAHDPLEPDKVAEFLACYADDDAPFGFAAERTRWAGLDACRRAAVAGDGEPLDHYVRMASWLCEEALRVAGVDTDDARQASRIAEMQAVRKTLADRSTGFQVGVDLRLQAFLGGPRVFAPVTHADSVFHDDPFDVEEVHAHVRETFERLVVQATSRVKHGERGRMMLVLGGSGAGKTHLMRAFRNNVHRSGRGFVTYAQMHSREPDYGRYLLRNVIESLERRYGPGGESSGLYELARGLPRLLGDGMEAQIEQLAETEWRDPEGLARYVNQLVDGLLTHPELTGFDANLLRALLYLQCNDPRITSRVLTYLRCEPMNAHDAHWIGDVQPRLGPDEPLRMIRQLARLAFVTRDAAFVVMVDQVELAHFDDHTIEVFQRAVEALYAVTSEESSAIAVMACLDDMYEVVRARLTASMLDRFTSDPPLAKLAIDRSALEVEAIVARRLEWLYADFGAVFRREEPTYPIPSPLLQEMTGHRTRTVLEECHRFQEACSAAGRLVVDWKGGAEPGPNAVDGVSPAQLDLVAEEWNEFVRDQRRVALDDDDAILELVAEAVRACPIEQGREARATRRNAYLDVDLGTGPATRRLTIGVTNRPFQGGKFGAQIGALRKHSRGRTPVALRTAEFPRGPASDAAIAALVKEGGGLKLVCPEIDLRALAAMPRFAAQRPGALLEAWRRRDQPLVSRESLAPLFVVADAGLGESMDESGQRPAAAAVPSRPTAPLAPVTPIAASAPTAPPAPAARTAPIAPAAPKPPLATGDLHVGTTLGLDERRFDLPPTALARHAGVLGSSGSGKTTLALNLVEQALERDVAVVLVDRKGDLAGYARPDWFASIADPADRARAEALAARIDVRLFTPGSRAGRPLSFGVVPRLEGLPEHERGRLVAHAASALAAMLRMGAGARDNTRRAILTQAIAVLAERPVAAGIEQLIDLLDTRDDALVVRVPKFDDKLFATLVNDLETLRLNEPELFDRHAEPLSAERLVARGPGGATPLSIVSTRFLGDTERVQAWSSQLFVELARWCGREPQSRLQVLVMLDEADHYMPAVSKPPSKEPLMDLLRRGRSGGLGVLLATQTPGDLDYKSRDLINSWFIGKIGDLRSAGKVRPLLERKPALAGKLAQLPLGQFVAAVNDVGVVEIARRPSLLRTDQVPDQEILALAHGAACA